MNKSLMMVIAALLVIVGLVMSGYNNLVELQQPCGDERKRQRQMVAD